MARDTCKGETDSGQPCKSPIVGPDGYCPAHRPGGREKLREAGKKGGRAMARKLERKGLEDGELPPLRTPQDAERWLETVARAVAVGRLGHHEGRTVVKAVREFLRAHEAGVVSERLDSLMAALSEWKKTGNAEPVLELIEGGRT